MTTSKPHSGLIFSTGPEGGCDDKSVGLGSVHWDQELKKYRLWYYCRDVGFNQKAPAMLGTGRIAVAESKNGIDWVRVDGPLTKGAVLEGGGELSDFDSLHLGMTDVTFAKGKWWMWCFGGNEETLKLPKTKLFGLRMRPALASSQDGIHWRKIQGTGPGGSAFDFAENDVFASWTNGAHDAGKFMMYYTAVSSPEGPFRTKLATSNDGIDWQQQGEIQWLDGLKSWEASGIMTRHIQLNPLSIHGKWLMIYTALDGDTKHPLRRSIAAATSEDGMKWRHVHDKPIFTCSSENNWDGGGVSATQLLVKDDRLYLYYFGFPTPENIGILPKGIGLAISTSGNLTEFERVEK